ncbi:uncharacterized protein LOC125863719 [Solanum stenotomum]|uniref:uncharacterized protein LOC125863719 n=1 Tax=Solanum stenotomum TaxID=172797 RepID=UPI0020D19E95|nr:uncharacterized protein LOC125863719 [Solanum stenotomum]
MAKVVKVDNRVKMYLEDDGYKKWSRVLATVNRGRMMTSNIVEWGNLCLFPYVKYHVYAVGCRLANVVPSTEFIYSVYEGGRRYIVCLERKNCNCGRFQLDEIPCAHTIAVMKKKNIIDIHPYYSDYYKPAALANTYEVSMVPMPDREDWTVRVCFGRNRYAT